ncbi:MAG TPA: hypothetical protein VHM30_01640 [Gemmatimonadaceae bacterium]|nr:hypothetical protein [Gemmatimonadaceae bacterium]
MTSSPGAEGAIRALGAGALLALACAMPPHLGAQERCSVEERPGDCSVDITVRRSPVTVMLLHVSEQSVTLEAPTLSAGVVRSQPVAGPLVRVFSNAPWELQIGAAQPFWRVAGSRGSTSKPASDLLWATSSAGPFAKLAQLAATAASGPAVAGERVQLYFAAIFNAATDAPGEYALDIVLTLSAP